RGILAAVCRTSGLWWIRNHAGAGATWSCTISAKVRRWRTFCLTGRSPVTTGTLDPASNSPAYRLLFFSKHASLELPGRHRFPLIELLRFASRNAQRLPFARAQMLGQQYDLSDVLGVVRDLAVDRLQHRVRLAPNRHSAHHVFRLERIKRPENA